MNGPTGEKPDFDTVDAYLSGYRMMRAVAKDFDPVRIVDDTWAVRQEVNQRMQNVADMVPGLQYTPPDMKWLAVDLLAAVGDFLRADPKLKPILGRHLESRYYFYDEIMDELMDEEDEEHEGL